MEKISCARHHLLMRRRFGVKMNAKAAAPILLLLLLVGCHAFSAHGDDAQGSGGGRRELGEGGGSGSKAQVAGLCVDSPCDTDPNRTCFCCTRLANEPCYDTLRQCFNVCPNCNFPVCPPPAASAGRRTRFVLAPASA
ncbi:hypothetical protein ACQJBY_054295 [Aegilops geniculata]